MIQLVFCRLT